MVGLRTPVRTFCPQLELDSCASFAGNPAGLLLRPEEQKLAGLWRRKWNPRRPESSAEWVPNWGSSRAEAAIRVRQLGWRNSWLAGRAPDLRLRGLFSEIMEVSEMLRSVRSARWRR